jgi:hypothetical protein
MIKDYPHTLSISGHTHTVEHDFFTAEHGNPGPEHHHYVAVTACGSWWTGAPDERGIPHATMSDGAPNGYTIISFDGSGYSMEFRAASEPADHQMRLWTPEEISQGELPTAEVIANIYAGNGKSTVEMRFDGGDWRPLTHQLRADPFLEAIKRLEAGDTPPPGRKQPKPDLSTHIWVGSLPETLGPGLHRVEVRTTDMFGRHFESSRAFRVRQGTRPTPPATRAGPTHGRPRRVWSQDADPLTQRRRRTAARAPRPSRPKALGAGTMYAPAAKVPLPVKGERRVPICVPEAMSKT